MNNEHMDNEHILFKSIELLQNKKQGIGFNRIPKDCKLKKQIESQKLEIGKCKEEINQLKKQIDSLKIENRENRNLQQKNNRKELLKNSDINHIINKNDDEYINLLNEYLIMKEYIINSINS
jgi:hypothetical protein